MFGYNEAQRVPLVYNKYLYIEKEANYNTQDFELLQIRCLS
jgi:hypothetical protein